MATEDVPLNPLYRLLRTTYRATPLTLRRQVDKLIFACQPTLWRHFPAFIRRTVCNTIYKSYPDPATRARLKHDLEERLRLGPGPSIAFLPTATWFSSGFQRPQQMARALAAVGAPVLYYEPWFIDFHSTQEGLKEREFYGLRDLAPRLHLLRCEPILYTELLSEIMPEALILLWPEQVGYIPPRYPGAIVYEIIDDHSLIDNATPAWHRTHQHWLKKADVVVASADDLIRQLQPTRPDVMLLPNAVYAEDWEVQGNVPIPEDLKQARQAPVVVTYYGAIADWFDWDMWEGAARARPDWSFVLIGYPYKSDFDAIKKRIAPFPNMYYLGKKPYMALPAYLKHMDIASIPFVLNPITHACSPVKLFEYMAAGKPVVASPMREILKYRSVLFAETAESFSSQLEKALRQRDDPEYQTTLRAEAKANTWHLRAEELVAAVRAALEVSDASRKRGRPHASAKRR